MQVLESLLSVSLVTVKNANMAYLIFFLCNLSLTDELACAFWCHNSEPLLQAYSMFMIERKRRICQLEKYPASDMTLFYPALVSFLLFGKNNMPETFYIVMF
ncbi:hypothetical protein BS78_08G103200 [Paspalum vaginatum]|nr:hypothetical protein BS78_08G103200 [Paspalum vaginatum]